MEHITLVRQTIPERLQRIAQPPACLTVLSDNWEDLLARPAVAIVGSRRPSRYGRDVTRRLAGELARQGIVIVSGLACGVDSEAHQAALDAGGVTIAVLPTDLHHIYPRTNSILARHITAQGGALVSEYDDGMAQPHKHRFIERNRIISGLSQVVIVTEASLTSGSRHTVDFALDQGRTVMAVPGRITDTLSAGPHQHLHDGAFVVRDTLDVLGHLGLSPSLTQPDGADPVEQRLLTLLHQGPQTEHHLLATSQLDVAAFNQRLIMLEIDGRIRHSGPGIWRLA